LLHLVRQEAGTSPDGGEEDMEEWSRAKLCDIVNFSAALAAFEVWVTISHRLNGGDKAAQL